MPTIAVHKSTLEALKKFKNYKRLESLNETIMFLIYEYRRMIKNERMEKDRESNL